MFRELLLSDMTLQFDSSSSLKVAKVNLKWFLDTYASEKLLGSIEIKYSDITKWLNNFRNKVD